MTDMPHRNVDEALVNGAGVSPFHPVAEGSGLRSIADWMLELHGATVVSDAGPLAFRELDGALAR